MQYRNGQKVRSPLPLDVVYDEQIKDCTLVYCYTAYSRVEPFYEFTVADGENEYKFYVSALAK